MRTCTWIFVCLIPVLLHAQPFNIAGNVIDGESKKTLAGAHVFINQSANAVQTDSSGHYSLKDINDKTFEVVVA